MIAATAARIRLGGEEVCLDPLGVAYLPACATLVVADLHLEKGSAFARRGTLLPPYDSARTLRRLGWAVERYRPRRVVSLGDAFHDRSGAVFLSTADRRQLEALQAGREWVWVRGNHDPEAPAGLDGDCVDLLELRRLRLVHMPEEATDGWTVLSGHLHPKARLVQQARKATRPCFVADHRRLLLPAFGAYAGGLNVLDPAIAGLFAGPFTAFMLGDARVFAVAHRHLTADLPEWRRHRLVDP